MESFSQYFFFNNCTLFLIFSPLFKITFPHQSDTIQTSESKNLTFFCFSFFSTQNLLKCVRAFGCKRCRSTSGSPSPHSAAGATFSAAHYSALCLIPLRLARVYKLKLAIRRASFSLLFEVGAEQLPHRKIREITLYRADVFFFPPSLGRFLCALERLGEAGRDGEEE